VTLIMGKLDLFSALLTGLQVGFDEPATAELSLPNDDRRQVFGPGHPYFTFFEEHSSGLVPLFEVDNAELSRRTAEEQGTEISAGRTTDRRAISGPLTPVRSGLSRSLADSPSRRSGP